MNSTPLRRTACRTWTLTMAAACALGGCRVTATPAHADAQLVFGYPVVVVDDPPVYVSRRPPVLYRGRKVYLHEDRWYYRTDRGWVYFREEPPELRRHRETLGPDRKHRATRHRDSRRRRYEAPEESRHRHYDP